MESKMKKVILASALSLPMSAVQAGESINWNSASLFYQAVDVLGDKLDGYGFTGTNLLSKNFFVAGSYSTVSFNYTPYGNYSSEVELDLNAMSLGVGYRYAFSRNTDLFSVVSYQGIEVERLFRNNYQDENGYGFQAGFRSLVSKNIELGGSISYVNIAKESETGFDISAMYRITKHFSLAVGYGKSEDVDTLSLSTVFFF
jgi:hypothetical protein